MFYTHNRKHMAFWNVWRNCNRYQNRNWIEMRSLSCVNGVHLICGIWTMKMNFEFVVFRNVETHKNQKQQRQSKMNVCYYYCYHFHPQPKCAHRMIRTGGELFGLVEHTLRQLSHFGIYWIYILYKLCGEHSHTQPYTIHSPLSTTAEERYIYRGGWEDLSTLKRKFMAYRQCHIWKIIHNI